MPPDAWNSMKSDRELMELAKTKTLEAIAEQLRNSQEGKEAFAPPKAEKLQSFDGVAFFLREGI